MREVYQEVSIAVDDKLISDATGRNALFKIHVSLGKIVNGLPDKEPKSRHSSIVPEDKTVVVSEEEEEKTELDQVAEEEESEGTILPSAEAEPEAEPTKLETDSLVDSLLSDEDVEMSGM
jgi:condensin complex subunit 3